MVDAGVRPGLCACGCGASEREAVGEGELDPELAGRLTGTGRPAGEGGASDVGGPGGARVRGEVKTNGA